MLFGDYCFYLVHNHNFNDMRMVPEEAEHHRAHKYEHGSVFGCVLYIGLVRHIRIHVEIDDKYER